MEIARVHPGGTKLETIPEVIRRAAAGDARAFETIYREHHRHVWALATRWESDPDRAEELLQEAFLRVWRSLPGFRGDSTLSTWIHAVAVRTAIDRVRKKERRRARERAAGASARDWMEPTPGLAVDLERAIAALPDGQRRMLVLHAIEGYRCREIAARMGVALGTVQSQVFRAREKLREVLDQ